MHAGSSLILFIYNYITIPQVLRAEKLGKGGKGKAISWSAIVHVVLVQAHSLTAMDAGDSSDPYCKLSLGKPCFLITYTA
jgi:hypothetical protein